MSFIWPETDVAWSKLPSIERLEDKEHGNVGAKASTFNADAYFTPERVAFMKRRGSRLSGELPHLLGSGSCGHCQCIAYVPCSERRYDLSELIGAEAHFYPFGRRGSTEI